jgi:hypothetical protein
MVIERILKYIIHDLGKQLSIFSAHNGKNLLWIMFGVFGKML